jgi:TusE/DsrC/DsvC family sulfur relay protein
VSATEFETLSPELKRQQELIMERDGDGFLIDMNTWTPEVMVEMFEADGVEVTDEKVNHINLAREMYEETSMVPRVKDFGKALGMDRKAKGLYDEWKTGPMKQIAKYGGLPKPTGCV